MPWPTTGPEPGTLGIQWAEDVEEVVKSAPLEHIASFKAPPEKFLPILYDLYNGEAVVGEPKNTLRQAIDVACEPLKGTVTIPKDGPMAGKEIWTRAIMLRAVVVDERQKILFELDSTI